MIHTLMTSYIMTPITIKNITGSRVEISLIIETSPRNKRITRKAHLITMISKSTPTMINQRTRLTFTLHL